MTNTLAIGTSLQSLRKSGKLDKKWLFTTSFSEAEIPKKSPYADIFLKLNEKRFFPAIGSVNFRN